MTQNKNPSAVAGHAPYGNEYTAYQLNRSPLRQWVRRHYLQAAAHLAVNATLDFGCGVGELLARLPVGSIGIEYNPVSVDHCRQRGLDVHWYDGFSDDFSLKSIDLPTNLETLFLSHVLEHFDDPVRLVHRLVAALPPALHRIVLIVPGQAGFRIDPTHRRFVDIDMVVDMVRNMPGWCMQSSRYFPLNHPQAGNLLPYNELQVVIDRTDPCDSSHQRLP